MTDERYLVVIETQRVKGYLFASPFLRETRGGSLLLDRLNRQRTQEILKARGGREIYLGGGAGRALFEAEEEARRFRREVEALYREEAPSARVSIAIVERREGESFSAWVSRGVGESRKNKLARAEALPLLGGRWVRPCTSCGREPAERIPPPDVQGRHLLCRACLAKREQIRSFYQEAKGHLDRRIPIPRASELRESWPGHVLTTLAEDVERRNEETVRTLLPKDFDDIGERSRPRNYVALIYADGNRMGETIRAMAGLFPEDQEAQRVYGAFSAIIDRSTREAAVEAVLAALGTEEMETDEGEPGRLVPAELVMAGGDDLILVVPAQAALEVAERFVARFHEKSLELQDSAVAAGEIPRRFAAAGLTTSAGVVIAHASYPASQLVELAAELMKSAKRRAADPQRNPGSEGTLDFMVIPESGTESLKKRRAEYAGKLPTGRAVHRTERPYTARECAQLRARILALKRSEVPRGKLKALYASLFRSPVEAQYEAARIRERLVTTGSVERSEPLRQLLEDLPFLPFRERAGGAGGDWSTPLSEIIEMMDFLHEAPEAAPAADWEETVA